ncbi:MAG: TIGR00730 family Rossman fold protein [Parasphingorhabdus sp.]|nr:TIGR00730 family Rossman fold protein [Parasphingorhabdus sp.]
MRSLAVYCGSARGSDPAFADTAQALGARLAADGIALVYGGGRLGLMGIVADAVLAGGGRVYGVIPETLRSAEVAHTGLTELFVVDDMHQRKAKMTQLTDAFVAMPGGIGTLDELFEAWTWHTLGYHHKPFALLNINGYWDRMIAFLDQITEAQFMSAARRDLLLVADNIDAVLGDLTRACANARAGVTW